MRSAAALCLVFAASAYAYTVTFPTESEGWTNSGAQLLSWSRVDTDPLNFTAVLVNNDASILSDPQILAAQVDGTLGNTTLNPPSGGWPSPDGGYRVNLVQNTTELNTILAQSPTFNITTATTTSSSASSTGNSASSTNVVGTTGTTATSTDSSSASTTSTTSSSNGAVTFGAQSGLFGILAFVGALLA
ncbi:GPI-anchored small secreted protein [Lentinula aciculospora]|uniref:GPI-anchored small secreted protein n=1 Tax=Lentinula aciculospora TaxID=153920 RepID=A0A9W9DNB1_9AGAR|nr:GPI-anchored small secreted protein [Lentinula aciculospora]